MEFGKIYYFVTKVMLYIYGKQLPLSYNVEMSNSTNNLIDVGLANSTLYSTSSASIPQNNTDNECLQMACDCGEDQTRTYNNLSTMLVLFIISIVGNVLLIVFVLLIIIPIKLKSKHNKHYDTLLFFILCYLLGYRKHNKVRKPELKLNLNW